MLLPYIIDWMRENTLHIRPLAQVDFRPPNPPILGGTWIQSPPILGDLGGIPGFMQEVYCLVLVGLLSVEVNSEANEVDQDDNSVN